MPSTRARSVSLSSFDMVCLAPLRDAARGLGAETAVFVLVY
jgi:hypothetical protein